MEKSPAGNATLGPSLKIGCKQLYVASGLQCAKHKHKTQRHTAATNCCRPAGGRKRLVSRLLCLAAWVRVDTTREASPPPSARAVLPRTGALGVDCILSFQKCNCFSDVIAAPKSTVRLFLSRGNVPHPVSAGRDPVPQACLLACARTQDRMCATSFWPHEHEQAARRQP